MTIKMNTVFAACLSAALTFGVFSATPAAAQSSVPAPQIGVIDVLGILNESLAGKGVALEYEKRINELQNEAQDLSEKFQAEEEELRQQQSLLAPDVFRPRVEEFQQRFQESNQQVGENKQRIDLARDIALRQLNAAVIQAAQQVAQENGLNMILYRQQLLFFNQGFDITRQVLAIVDREVPTVEFPDPASIGAQAAAAEAPAQ